jgi:hypothetical protein
MLSVRTAKNASWREIMSDQKRVNEPVKFPNLGFGLFILAASLLTLGEYFGVVPKDLRWGLPLVGVIWGFTVVVRAIFTKN